MDKSNGDDDDDGSAAIDAPGVIDTVANNEEDNADTRSDADHDEEAVFAFNVRIDDKDGDNRT